MTLLIAAFALLRVVAVAGLDPVEYSDTGTYFEFDLFGGATRLWTVPLLFNATQSQTGQVVAQVTLGVVAWGALAVAVARMCVDPVVARAGAVLVLLLGLTVQVTQWDLILLSESTALSLTVLVTALGLRLAVRPESRWTLAALLGVLLLWSFTRHSNALVFVLAFPVVAGILIWRLPRKPALAIVGVVGLIALWSAVAISREDTIWRGNAYGILVIRILPDQDATRHFTDRGLRVTPALRRDVITQPGIQSPAFRDARFQRWLEEEWRSAYGSFLLSRPRASLTTPLSADLISANPDYAKPRSVLPRAVQSLLWGSVPGLALLAAAALAMWLVSFRRGPPRPADVVPWAALGLGFVWAELTWHLSAAELARLSVPGGLAIRLGIVLLLVLGADRLATARAG